MPPENEVFAHRILIVDDNPSIHADFRKILCPQQSQASADVASLEAEIFGNLPQAPVGARFEMDSAFQGQEALAKVKAAEAEGRPYSLAFMDVRMPPGWDGIETIAHIWQEYPAIQVVMCTAYSDYGWEEILRKLGESDSLVILKKPFDNVEVLQLAHALTKKWAMTRQAKARMADLDDMVSQRTRELVDANRNLEREVQRRATVESALRASEERFRKAFETASVALSIRQAATGRFLDVNQSFVSLTGYGKEELIGATPEELNVVLPTHPWTEISARLEAGLKVQNVEMDLRAKDGKVRQTIVSVEVLILEDQPCQIAALLDVTDQRRLEAQLRQAQKMEAVGRLSAGIAHDFNNLLTVIHGYASLQLAKSSLDRDVAKAFNQVKLASERAATLTRQLLMFSRKQVVQRKPLDVGALLGRMQSMLSRVVGETIRLECTCNPASIAVPADESSLEQVVMNLVVNARDAMPNGGCVRLNAELTTVTAAHAGAPDARPGQFVRLAVTDTGTGMDPETLSRLFEPFYTTKPVGRGTGLGLATVEGIIKQHEGWIEVQSQLGQGTTFHVYLPTAQERSKPEPSAPKAITSNPAASNGEVVLVAEDEPNVREYVTAVLSSNGYRVVSASTGLEALAQYEQHRHTTRLLLTDMVMPDGMGGGMLARKLLQLNPALRVIYTSGYSPEAVANGASLTEGLNFLSKPFSREGLLNAVQNALTSDAEAVELLPEPS
ncbi:MAG: response regulator [Verrucomicrobiota bacterium]